MNESGGPKLSFMEYYTNNNNDNNTIEGTYDADNINDIFFHTIILYRYRMIGDQVTASFLRHCIFSVLRICSTQFLSQSVIPCQTVNASKKKKKKLGLIYNVKGVP